MECTDLMHKGSRFRVQRFTVGVIVPTLLLSTAEPLNREPRNRF